MKNTTPEIRKQFPYSSIGVTLLAGYLIHLGDIDNAMLLLLFFGAYKLMKS